MAEARKRTDYFGTFLETVKQAPPEQEKEPAENGPSDPPMLILGLLAEAGPMAVAKLQEATGLEFGPFGESLAAIVKAGLATLSGTPGQETAELTESGRSIASLATS